MKNFESIDKFQFVYAKKTEKHAKLKRTETNFADY